jgi:hypothetical protein
MTAFVGTTDVAKKAADGARKRHGTLIRVSDEFAAALDDATRLEKTSVAKFADQHLLPVVRKRYRDMVLKEAKRLGDEAK